MAASKRKKSGNKVADAVVASHQHPGYSARETLLGRLSRLSHDEEQAAIMDDATVSFKADATKYNRDFIQKGKNWESLYAPIKKEKDELKKENGNKKGFISVDIAAFEKKVKELKEFHQLEVKIGINTNPEERNTKIAKLEELIANIKKKRGITNQVAPLSVESKTADAKNSKPTKPKPASVQQPSANASHVVFHDAREETDEISRSLDALLQDNNEVAATIRAGQARGQAVYAQKIDEGLGFKGRPAARDLANASYDELEAEIAACMPGPQQAPASPFTPKKQPEKTVSKAKPAVNHSNEKDDSGCSCNCWAMLFGNSNQSSDGYKKVPETPRNKQGQKR
jgi:hypothetical protein